MAGQVIHSVVVDSWTSHLNTLVNISGDFNHVNIDKALRNKDMFKVCIAISSL